MLRKNQKTRFLPNRVKYYKNHLLCSLSGYKEPKSRQKTPLLIFLTSSLRSYSASSVWQSDFELRPKTGQKNGDGLLLTIKINFCVTSVINNYHLAINKDLQSIRKCIQSLIDAFYSFVCFRSTNHFQSSICGYYIPTFNG